MELGDISLACAVSLVDGLVDGGVAHASLSPGSRSTPLALALARDPRVQVHVHLDERSGSFFALGIAKATGRPAIVACTSGTAAAELLPAVVEASQSRLPLLVVTADRPPRVRGTGANQTIVQPDLYGGYVHASFDLPVPSTAGQEAWWRQAAHEALQAMAADPVGPVHLNCPFEEPLSPSIAAPAPAGGEPIPWASRPPAELDPDEADRLIGLVSGARGAVVFGGLPGHLSGDGGFWSELLGWPVLAEPTSGARRPGSSLAAGQALIASSWAEAHRPEVVIQFGAYPTSRATQRVVAAAEQLVVADRWHLDPDPDRLATWRLAVDAEALPHALARHPIVQGRVGIALTSEHPDDTEDLWSGRIDPAPAGWHDGWHEADSRTRTAMDALMDGWEEPFEPRIARDVAAWLPDGAVLFGGNSTPVRDLDLAMRPRERITVMANRGASGIDGLVSTALGVSAARRGPTVALLGDLSFLHDAGAILWNARRGIDLTVVVVNNGGGQLFSLLPQRELPEHRELFVTPHEVDIGGLWVVEVVVDAELGLRRRHELRAAVDTALAGS